MAQLAVTESSAGIYLLEGELNRSTVAHSEAVVALQKNHKNTNENGVVLLDMQGVTHADTAGLAWLMNFLKSNLQQNIRCELRNIPESLIKLAKISDVDGFLSVQ